MVAEPVGQAALYLRLSREDGDTEQSGSIQSQQLLLTEYAKRNGMTVSAIYTDDGISGTKWNRPGLQELLRAAESGQIRVILVKDLSRLSRDYVKTGELLEEWFPKYGIRLIAVEDGIDTAKQLPANDFSPMRAVLNDWYARDISRKVRAAVHARQESGLCTAARLPYGYRKTEGRILVDPAEAAVVIWIFKSYLDGKSRCAIARKLTEDGIRPPGEKWNRNIRNWNDATIGRILKNSAYCGKLMLHKTEKLSYKSNRKQQLPAWMWTVYPIPAVIGEEVFEAVRTRIEQKPQRARNRTHWLSGRVYCGECESRMYVTSRNRVICSGRKHGTGCKNPSMSLSALEEMLSVQLERDGISVYSQALPILLEKIVIRKETAELYLRYKEP